MNPPKLIGITGRKHSGKDTVARLLLSELENYAYSEEEYLSKTRYDLKSLHQNTMVNVYAFADPLYAMLSAMTGKPVALLHQHKDAEINGVTVRRLLQTLGTEWGRNQLGPNWWVGLMHERIANTLYCDCIIPDVRFNKEACYIRNHNGVIWQIDNNRLPEPTDPHASEAGIDEALIDERIDNHGHLEVLKAQVSAALRCFHAHA